MGYDLYISVNGERVWEGYMTYNFSKYKEYYYIPRDWRRHTVAQARELLKKGIAKLAEDGVENVAGKDCWETTLENFMHQLQGLLNMLESGEFPDDAVVTNDYNE
jgi:hypothetical protein